jgi:hypothetical protein
VHDIAVKYLAGGSALVGNLVFGGQLGGELPEERVGCQRALASVKGIGMKEQADRPTAALTAATEALKAVLESFQKARQFATIFGTTAKRLKVAGVMTDAVVTPCNSRSERDWSSEGASDWLLKVG